MAVETERVTLRLPVADLALLDALVQAGAGLNRSELIRDAIRDYVRSRAKEVQMGVEASKTVFESAQQANDLREIREAIKELQKLVGK